MKKIFLTMALTAALASASAALPKGSIYVGLNLGYNSRNWDYHSTNGNTTTNTQKVSYTNWSLGPSGQYFLADNVSVGLGFDIYGNKYMTEIPTSKDKTTQIDNGMGFNIFGRKYFECAETFYTYGELGFGFGSSNGKYEVYDDGTATTTTTKSEGSDMNAALRIGFAWMATPRVMFQGGFGVLSYMSSNDKTGINAAGDQYSKVKYSGLQLSFTSGSLPFSLGFAYRIAGGGE
jgi:hypothetical protein